MKRYNRNTILLILGTIFVVTGQILMVREQNLGAEKAIVNKASHIQQLVVNANKVMASVDSSIASAEALKKDFSALSWDAYSSNTSQLKTADLDLFVFEMGNPIFWTTQNFQISPNATKTVELRKQGNWYVIFFNRQYGNRSYVYTLPILEAKNISYKQSQANLDSKITEYTISRNPLKNSTPLVLPGIELLYLVVDNYQAIVWFDILFLLGFLMMSMAIFSFYKLENSHLVAVSGLAIAWLTVHVFFESQYTLNALKSLSIFSPDVFYSKFGLGSIGEFLFYAILALFIVGSLLRWIEYRVQQSSNQRGKFILANLMMQLSLWVLILILLNGLDLVYAGQINLDFQQFHRLDTYSFIAVIALGLQWLAFYRIYGSAWKAFHQEKAWVGRLCSFAQALPPFIFLYTQESAKPVLYYWLAFVLAWLILEWWLSRRQDWLRVVLRVVLAGVVVSSIFGIETGIKEKQTRRILAQKILEGADFETLELLKTTQDQLLKDKGIVDYYTCTDETKAEFEKRLRELYFDSYSNNFELNFLDYNAFGQSYRLENAYDYSALQQLFKGESCIPITSHFVKVGNLKLKGSYVGRFDVSSQEGYLGVLFVILTPRFNSMEGRLSGVFTPRVLEPVFADNQYSFGIYNNNRLNFSYGFFDYALKNQFPHIDGFFDASGTSHFVLKDSSNNTVILSRTHRDFIPSLTGFTFLVLGGIVLILLYYLVLWVQQRFISMGELTGIKLRILKNIRSRMPLGNRAELFISSRLQLYVTWMVFATFLVVLFVTVNYFIRNYTTTQKDDLRKKGSEIAAKISSKINIDAVFDKYQTGLVYDLAEYYNTDISLYRTDGTLLVTTNDRLIEESVRGRLMNPIVFEKMHNFGTSTSLVNEKLGDLDYISSYTALLNKDLEVRGYLNLPYFSNREDLYRDISEYAVTIINLFALVFAIMVVIAYLLAQRIALPLNLIRKQLASLKIGERNQLLDWDKNDEIGLLVKEYNKMIVELDSSYDRLSESERQGAWREMAKQVAHEIKNPLTPMRLSLQHLQSSLTNDDKNLKDKIQKTSELLIRQIDSLSQMAEEFSSFAKMPDPKLEKVKLELVINDAVSLIGKESSLRIQWVAPAKTVLVEADPLQLVRVFTNILKNALQSIPDGKIGVISVSISLKMKRVEVRISDNGKGIPETFRDKIFSPNFSTKNSGMGLGLGISKKIVEQLGGEISYQTSLDKGTTFTIVLPLLVSKE